MTSRSAKDNSKAFEAFVAAKADIDAMLKRLQSLSADHFHANPDVITWGDVGTLTHCVTKLREITDIAFQEGEYAE